jgi:PAS domain S-box-containing protein
MAKAKILVVEDEGVVAMDIVNRLKNLGYDVPAVAFSGKQAIHKAEELRADLVLMDIVLKGDMDGIEAAKQIRERFDIPVIYLTAYADDKTLSRAKITEPFGYIIKPFEERELHTNIEIALHKHKMEKALRKAAEEIRRRNEELATLNTISQVATHSLNLKTMEKEILQTIQAKMDVDATVIAYIDKKTRLVVPSTFFGISQEIIDTLARPQKASKSLMSLVASTGESIVVEDWSKEMKKSNPKLADLVEKEGLEPFAFVPISSKDKIIGVLGVGRKSDPKFTPSEVGLLLSIGNQIGATIENAWLYGLTQQELAQRKQTEKALWESEKKYRVLVENANEAIIVAQDGMFKFFNPKVMEITGYSREELADRLFVEFIHPDDKKMVMERHLRRLKGEEFLQVYPFRIIDKRGNIKWVEINAVLITWEKEPATLNFLSDITERKRAEEELARLSRKIINVQEEERKRISLELHDEIGQALTAVSVNLGTLEDSLPASSKPLRKKFVATKSLVHEVTENVRRISHDLWPAMLEDLGLVPALRWYTNRISKATNIDLQLKTTMAVERLPDEPKTVLYRAVQEGLTNILKHARADRVKIQLKPNDKFIELHIEDNGVGFKVEEVLDNEKQNGGLGLLGMRERVKLVGGTLDIISNPGKGTKLLIKVPC